MYSNIYSGHIVVQRMDLTGIAYKGKFRKLLATLKVFLLAAHWLRWGKSAHKRWASYPCHWLWRYSRRIRPRFLAQLARNPVGVEKLFAAKFAKIELRQDVLQTTF